MISGIPCTLSLKDRNGVIVRENEVEISYAEIDNFGENMSTIMRREDIFNPANKILKDGALCIDVTVQIKPGFDDLCDPKETEYHQDKMLQLLDNTEKSDISVNIDEEVFRVHSLILDNNAPLLSAHCKQTNYVVEDMDPKVFRMILQYVYTGYCPFTKDILAFGKELIDAANRFELANLKLVIETVLVCERVINKSFCRCQNVPFTQRVRNLVLSASPQRIVEI